jgi:DNA modification methylase
LEKESRSWSNVAMKNHQITPTCTVLEGDVLECLKAMPDGFVNVCVTSPPYWGLRSYLKPDDPLKSLEMGGEPTPAEYIARQVAVFHEVKRVLHPTGILAVNIGDTYSSGGRANYGITNDSDKQSTNAAVKEANRPDQPPDYQSGEPVGIPDMLKNALRADGWRHRDTVIWAKPAPMPQSVGGWRWERCKDKTEDNSEGLKARYSAVDEHCGGCLPGAAHMIPVSWQDCPGCDKCRNTGGYVLRKGQWRTTTSHESIFLFVKSDKYFCDAAGVKEAASVATISRNQYNRVIDDPDEQYAVKHDHEFTKATLNPRSVQTWGQEPCKFAHYAAYPSTLPAFFIKAGTSPKGRCCKCGTPWSPMVETYGESTHEKQKRLGHSKQRGAGGKLVIQSLDYAGGHDNSDRGINILGYRQSCSCTPADSEPCHVLDPYAGTGTTLAAAEAMGIVSVGIELNPKYVEMIRQRILYKDAGSGKDIISGKKFF